MEKVSVNFNKGKNDIYPILLNDNTKIGTITLNKYEYTSSLHIFFIDITSLEHMDKGYFPATIKFLEHYGKNNHFKYLICEWIDPKYIDFYLKRKFRELTKEEYQHFPIQKESNERNEISVIKNIS